MVLFMRLEKSNKKKRNVIDIDLSVSCYPPRSLLESFLILFQPSSSISVCLSLARSLRLVGALHERSNIDFKHLQQQQQQQHRQFHSNDQHGGKKR